MTEDPPPWARPAPDARPDPRDAEPRDADRVTPVPESTATRPAAVTEQPLFADREPSGAAYLFPGPVPRRRQPDELPPVPGNRRRVNPAGHAPQGDGTGPDQRAGSGSDREAATSAAGSPPAGRRPPPLPAPVADADGRTAPASVAGKDGAGKDGAGKDNVGVVAGPVVTTVARRQFWGFQALIAAAAVSMCATIGQALAGSLRGATLVIGFLGPALLVAAVGAARWAVTGRRRTPTGRRGGWAPSETVSVRRFRVQAVAGDARSYLIEGELPDDVPQTGDIVRVRGRRLRDGHIVVREVDIMATLNGPVVRSAPARPGPEYLAARWISRLGFGLAVLMSLGAVMMIFGVAR